MLQSGLSRWKWVIVFSFVIKLYLILVAAIINQSVSLQHWIIWDGPHYLDIAQHGYQNHGEISLFIVFYPLYPLLIKLLSLIISSYSWSAIVISWLFSLIANIIFYELVRLDFNHKIALRSVWWLTIFPTAYFWQASYTESVFLLLSILSIYSLRKNYFKITPLTSALSSFTRINGLLLIPSLLLEAKNYRQRLVILLTAPLGFMIYLLINYLVYGDWFYFKIPLAQNWYKYFEWPWIGLINLWSYLGKFEYIWTEFIALILLLITAIYSSFYLRKSYAVYCWLNLILFTSTSFIISTPRYLLIIWPIYIMLGRIKSTPLNIILNGISIISLTYFTIRFVQGHWAF